MLFKSHELAVRRDGWVVESAPLLREYSLKRLSRVRIPLSPQYFEIFSWTVPKSRYIRSGEVLLHVNNLFSQIHVRRFNTFTGTTGYFRNNADTTAGNSNSYFGGSPHFSPRKLVAGKASGKWRRKRTWVRWANDFRDNAAHGQISQRLTGCFGGRHWQIQVKTFTIK